jgi:hypothetical protein
MKLKDFLFKYSFQLAATAVFIIYLITLSPSVIQIDAGELAAVQSTLGIAHPTGYPLFTIVGYLFLLIPFPFAKIFMANLLAAIWCSMTIFLFYKTASLVMNNLNGFRTTEAKSKTKKVKENKNVKQQEVKSESTGLKILISIIAGGLVLALSKTFWFQSTSVEVYSLHLFLMSLIIHFLIKAYLKEGNDLSSWLLFSVFLALGFTNHMTTLLIIPSTAYLFFVKNKFNKESFKKIGIMLAVFLPVLILIYSYLPIRAAQNPVINWGNPIDMERILRHVSGKQYQVWLFSSMDAAKKQFVYFFNNLPAEFAIVNLLFVVIGIFTSFFRAKRFFIFNLITFLTCLLYSINYDIIDIDSYFLLAYIALSFFAVFGILRMIQWFESHKISFTLSSLIIFLFCTVQFYINLDKVNQSKVYIFEDYSKTLINSTAKNSIIFSYQWDFFISASYYYQNVENFRKDVSIIDKELLRRSWYFNQLRTNYPKIISKVEGDFQPFLAALKPFERDENFDSNLLERLYQNLMNRLVTTNFDEHPYYIGPELYDNEMRNGQWTLPQGYYLVPDLFLFKVVRTNDYVPAADPKFTIRLPQQNLYYYNFIKSTVGSMLVRRAMYELKFDKIERAKLYINKIRKDLPDYQIPPELNEVFK